MKTPCAADLVDAAATLRGDLVDDPTAADRVAQWLCAVAQQQDNRSRRARARAAGVSTKYMRTVLEADPPT